jgi:hypothetical protein
MVGRERFVNVGRKTYGIKKLIDYENRAVYSFFELYLQRTTGFGHSSRIIVG